MKPGFRALVADDDPITRTIVAEQLRNLGASDVVCVENGRMALQHLQAESEITLLVTDLRMPEMDGVHLLRELVAVASRPDIVLISGLGDRLLSSANQLAAGHGLNILGSLNKPVKRNELQALLGQTKRASKQTSAPQGKPDPAAVAQSVEAQELDIFVQPEVPLNPDMRLGVEVLARWSDPELAAHGTESLIRTAEQLGLIGAITDQIFAKANRAWERWSAAGVEPRMSFNVSALSFEDVGFPDKLQRALILPPEDIVIEVTETALSEAWMEHLDVATRLRLQGFGLAIDDYGTGYSTLSELHQLPFEELKIDQSFIARLGLREEITTIVKSTVQLAQNLGLRTVTEGVETLEQLSFVAAMKADYVQGYLLAKPMPVHEFLGWTRSFKMPDIPRVSL